MDAAIENAKLALQLDKCRWEDAISEKKLKSKTKNPSATYYPTPVLEIVAINGDYKNPNFRLAWKFNIAGVSVDKAWTVYIDAIDGNLIYKNSLVINDIAGTATTYYNGTRNINCYYDSNSGYYLLLELQRGPYYAQEIYTLDANNDSLPTEGGNVYQTSQYIGSTSTSFTNDPVANNVHWGAEKSYDFFYNLFGRNSFDGQGTFIYNLVHYKYSYNNAFWSAYDTIMCYGDGDGVSMDYVVGIDIIGHEFTHAVTKYSANLQYQMESGALSESFSDIFGTGVEAYALGANSNWLIGENVMLESPYYMRSMENPNATELPDTYDDNLYWVSQVGCVPNGDPASPDYNDLCGVHYNCGVQNFWFFLLVMGGSGVNDIGDSYSVTGISMNDALDIAYRNLTQYLTPTSDYVDAMYGSIAAASDLFGSNSQQKQSVINAWCAVGVGPCSPNVINNRDLTSVKIYPNPANDKIEIQGLQSGIIEIINIQGQIIKTIDIYNKTSIDLTKISCGVYTIKIKTNDGIIVKKLIKE